MRLYMWRNPWFHSSQAMFTGKPPRPANSHCPPYKSQRERILLTVAKVPELAVNVSGSHACLSQEMEQSQPHPNLCAENGGFWGAVTRTSAGQASKKHPVLAFVATL
jgi:hypothetical protein